MSMLDDFAAPCIIMEKHRTSDGEGGYSIKWTEGATFNNYQGRDESTESKIAEAQGFTSVYSVLVDKDVPIDYNDFFKNMKTGLTYRVTSDPIEKQAPESASPLIRELKYFTAERKDLPTL